MTESRSFRLLTPDFSGLRKYFAIPAFIAVAAAALQISEAGGSNWRERALLTLAAAGLATLAASLFAQSQRLTPAGGLIVQLIAGACATALAWFADAASVFLPALYAGLALACLAAPSRGFRDASSFWVWAEHFCAACAFAYAATLIAWGATTATLSSADHLFHLGLPNRFWGDVAVFFFVGFGPVLFLSLQPPIDDTALEAGEKDLIRRAHLGVSSWALTPFVLIYSALLWLYAGKIALERALPDGQIGFMVGAFGVTALATIFLIFPLRESGPRQTRLLWRVWPYLAIAPLILLGFAIHERVATYGLTTDRYIAITLAGLCAASALTALLSREAVIRFAPAAGALALIATSFGFWGAKATAMRWQEATLRDIYAAQGLLKDGLIIVGDKPPTLDGGDVKRCRGAVDFISDNGGIHRLAHKPIEIKTGSYEDALCGKAPDDARATYHSYSIYKNWSAPQGFDKLTTLGFFMLHSGQKLVEMGAIKIDVGAERMTVTDGALTAYFDFEALNAQFNDKGEFSGGEPILKPSSGDDRLFFLIETFALETTKGERPKLSHLRGFLMRRE